MEKGESSYLTSFSEDFLIIPSTVLLDAGNLDIPSIKPGANGKISLPVDAIQHKAKYLDETWVTVVIRTKSAVTWADAGHEVAWYQHRLSGAQKEVAASAASNHVPGVDTFTSRSITIKAGDTVLEVDRSFANITSWKYGGEELLFNDHSLSAPFQLGFWRPPTDNDAAWQTNAWKHWGLDSLTVQSRGIKLHRISGELRLETITYVSPPILAWGFLVKTTYRILGDGSIYVKTHLNPEGSAPINLPRVGWELHLQKTLDHAVWFGRGPGEAYNDKKSSQKLGIYRTSVDELHTPYDIPQENGNRLDTRWVKLVNARGVGFKATLSGSKRSPGLFQWAASRYSAVELERARHEPELQKDDRVYLRLDADVAGVGTGACGPGTDEEDQVKCEEMQFEIHLQRQPRDR